MIKRVKYMLLIYLTGIVLLEAVTSSAAAANEQRITQFIKYIEYMVDKHCSSDALDILKRPTRNILRVKANVEHTYILKITRAGMVTITHEIVPKDSFPTVIWKLDTKFQLTDVHEITVIQSEYKDKSYFTGLYTIKLGCNGGEKLIMVKLTRTIYNALGDTVEKIVPTPKIYYLGTDYLYTKDKLVAEKIARAFRGLKTLLSKYK